MVTSIVEKICGVSNRVVNVREHSLESKGSKQISKHTILISNLS